MAASIKGEARRVSRASDIRADDYTKGTGYASIRGRAVAEDDAAARQEGPRFMTASNGVMSGAAPVPVYGAQAPGGRIPTLRGDPRVASFASMGQAVRLVGAPGPVMGRQLGQQTTAQPAPAAPAPAAAPPPPPPAPVLSDNALWMAGGVLILGVGVYLLLS